MQLRAVVRLCHANAVGALARRGHLDRLIRLHGLNLSDLAYDCISDLFARGETGKYLALESYFSAYDISAFTDEEVYFHLQRLSFAKVRNGIFRLYSEMDPQLAKILHNIKVAVRALDFFVEVDRLGDSCLKPSLCEANDRFPPPSVDELVTALLQEASGREFIPELLGKLSMILRRETEHCRILPMVTVGLAIREFYRQKEIAELPEPVAVSSDVTIDTPDAIRRACADLRRATYPKYVGRRKVSAEIYETYFQVIEEMLKRRFVDHDGSHFQLCENFLKLMPGISLEHYRKRHRHQLEYLAKLAHARVARTLQRE